MRIIPQLDAYPRLVCLVQTPLGKISAIIAFALLMLVNGEALYLELAAIVAVLSFFPKYRRPLLSAATLYWLLLHPNWIPQGLIRRVALAEGIREGWGLVLGAAVAMCVVFCGLGVLLRIVRTRPSHFAGRRPVLVLVGSFLLLLAAAGTLSLHGWARVAIWMLLALAGPYLWFFAYALGDYASKAPDSPPRQFGTFFPFWVGSGGSSTPIGKGAAYLRKVEARTPKDLAVVQLKAVKLLMWIFVLHMVLLVFRAVVFGDLSRAATEFCRAHGFRIFNLGVPTLEAAFDRTAAGQPPPLHMLWAGVVAHFFAAILAVPLMGNMVVACSRMAGFNLLRNTYKPLYATTIAEFWNRFYFYFKELLVEFFFFPTYVRYFKKHRRLRLAAATFAAATLGNLVYHFCRDINYVFELGFWRALTGFQVYAFYAAVLGASIALSQLRGKRAPGPLPFHRRVIASVGVIGFYCLLEIFDYEGRSHSLGTHLAFFGSLFPLAR
jgi:hypothetical protein